MSVNLGLNDGFFDGLSRAGIGYEFDQPGQVALTDAFLSADAVATAGRLASQYDAELCVADNVLVVRRKNVAVNHLNHHPYYHVA